ncbi:DUF7344 domain-containing protein [Halopiger djelfimassiliensis]|uniref:DUF7344 domain-containing protein n=1 Tax=Halopiger djelfimassiliensis TaxID=1293047 RepID=UPI00067795A9|nr:hypothetical protein [Halopiger djelfimassiliensis]
MSSCPASRDDTTVAFDLLAPSQRRHVLAVLLEQFDAAGSPTGDPLTIETLATEVAALEHDTPIVTDDQCTRTQVTLVHVHLPRLEDVGVVRLETDGGTVRPNDHPIFDAEWVRSLLANPTDGAVGNRERLDRTLEVLRPPHRRRLCSVLAGQRRPVSVADLAALLVTAEHEMRLVDVSESECRATTTELVYSSLPALSDAGLLEYDEGADEVALVGDAPQWHTDWMAASPLGEISALLRPETDRSASGSSEPDADDSVETDSLPGSDTADAGETGACWTIEGTEQVLARGRELIESAESELFVMLPDAAMIQRGCLEGWYEATERGVDVSVGSRSPRVRDTVRSAVPDATVCEPRFDWINVPVDRLHHGRVVFADRERVLLVTVDDCEPDASPRLTAITGEGAENPLVSLVCEHIGPRLDQLDARRERADESDGTATSLPM